MDKKTITIIMLICSLTILGILGCQRDKVTVITEDGSTITTGGPNDQAIITAPNTTNFPPPDVAITASSPVRLVFNIRSEFPSGNVRPDRVVMDGIVIQEDTSVLPGTHNFVVEKRGYQTQTENVIVSDVDQDGLFRLHMQLTTKPRLVLFDIRDAKTKEVIMPDQVTIVRLPEGQQQSLSNSVTVQPGRKKLVIQKQKYQTISEDITIEPDEDPYMMHYELQPLE